MIDVNYEGSKKTIEELTRANDEWRKKTINLIASENVMSPRAQALYNSDFMHRYAEGDPFKRFYNGTHYTDYVELMATNHMKDLFHAPFCDVRVLSGTMANLAVYYGLTKPGDYMLANSTNGGGHISHTDIGAAGCRGIKTVFYNWDKERMNIDMDDLRKKAEEYKPKVILLGNSLYLFPTPVKEAKEIADSIGATLVYDAAHVLGLIAGNQFQDPLGEGADIMTSSTHKTFPGPQGGVIFAKDEERFKLIRRALFPGLVCNHHLHRLPALATTALEMMEFGEDYAKKTIENAQRLGNACTMNGIATLCDSQNGVTTMSHQVVIDIAKTCAGKDGAWAAKKCEDAGIILNKNMIPGDTSPFKPTGIRIGTQEMTRMGMGLDEMDLLADLLLDLLVAEDQVSNVRKQVYEMRAGFQTIGYC